MNFIYFAGIGGHNAGKSPDPRSIEVAAKHGVALSGIARQFQTDDFNKFDLVIAMDLENRDLLFKMSLSNDDKKKIHLLREFDPKAEQDLVVPDPYYGGADGFETVYTMIERSCQQLLVELKNNQLQEKFVTNDNQSLNRLDYN